MQIQSINAITLASSDMEQSVKFYSKLGFKLLHGGVHAGFTTFKVGNSNYLNITKEGNDFMVSWWGRVIFYVSDVDELHTHVINQGITPEFAPRDATWHERYFHITDPDGHELSFAQRINPT